jgi:hypothetical protein
MASISGDDIIALLRSDRPIPTDIRQALAETIDPGGTSQMFLAAIPRELLPHVAALTRVYLAFAALTRVYLPGV